MTMDIVNLEILEIKCETENSPQRRVMFK